MTAAGCGRTPCAQLRRRHESGAYIYVLHTLVVVALAFGGTDAPAKAWVVPACSPHVAVGAKLLLIPMIHAASRASAGLRP